jgi:hypothetical protein
VYADSLRKTTPGLCGRSGASALKESKQDNDKSDHGNGREQISDYDEDMSDCSEAQACASYPASFVPSNSTLRELLHCAQVTRLHDYRAIHGRPGLRYFPSRSVKTSHPGMDGAWLRFSGRRVTLPSPFSA